MSITVRLALHLPRDAATVPLVRRLLDQALRTLGVEPSCRDDVGLILTEACANVIEHALQIDDYEIGIDVTSERCTIHVVNAGAVVDPARLSLPAVYPAAAAGPGTGGASGIAAGPGIAAGSGIAATSGIGAGSGSGIVAAGPGIAADPGAAAASGIGTGPEAAAGSRIAAGLGIGADSGIAPAGAGAAGMVDGGSPGVPVGAPAADGPVGGPAAGGPLGPPADGGARATAAGGPGGAVPAARCADGGGPQVFDPVLDEHGRGLHIIRSLADELYLTPSLSGGLVLQAVTTLRWTADAEVWQRR